MNIKSEAIDFEILTNTEIMIMLTYELLIIQNANLNYMQKEIFKLCKIS
jgi:hypothetical protein